MSSAPSPRESRASFHSSSVENVAKCPLFSPASARTDGQSDVTGDPASYNLVAQASYAAVVADRDARPTLAEVQDARVGSIVLAKDWETNAVSLCFGLQKTDDLVSWTAFKGGTWSEAPNGEFKLTLPLDESKKWLRLILPE